jgi:putative transposase
MANVARTSRLAHGGAYFVTLGTYERRPVFQISRIAELFIETLLQYRRQGQFKLHAFLVMPDHVHLLLTPDSMGLEQTVGLIQKGFVQRLASQQAVWEAGMTAHPIRNLHDLESVRAYLHQTPVRAHITSTAELYPYSSAHRQTEG